MLNRYNFAALQVAVSNDETRHNLSRPYFDGKAIVATDGHRIHFTEDAPELAADAGLTEPTYLELAPKFRKTERADQAILAGLDLNATFPNWRQIVPEEGVLVPLEPAVKPAWFKKVRQGIRQNHIETFWTVALLKELSAPGVVVFLLENEGIVGGVEGLLPELPIDAPMILGRYFAEALRFVAGIPSRVERHGEKVEAHDVKHVTLQIGDRLDPAKFEGPFGTAVVMGRLY